MILWPVSWAIHGTKVQNPMFGNFCSLCLDSVCNEVWSAWPICQANLPMHRWLRLQWSLVSLTDMPSQPANARLQWSLVSLTDMPSQPANASMIAFAMKFGQPDRYAKPTCQCIDALNMLPLPFHHALQHHGCSVPFVHHHPHCKLFTFLEQKKSHCASGLAERSNEQLSAKRLLSC